MKEYTLSVPDCVLVVKCSPPLEQQARWLLGTIARFRKEPKGIHPGTRIEIGWSTLTLIEKDARLIVCEPDFSRDPFIDSREDLTCTLTVLAQQSDLLNKLGVDGVGCSFQDKIVLAKGSIGLDRIYMERSEPTNARDSGWYVGPVDNVPVESYEAIYVYQLLGLRP